MIRLTKIFFGDTPYRYLLFGRTRLPSVIRLDKTPEACSFDKTAQREVFVYSPLDSLVKIKIDKYTFCSRPIRWLGRILIQERLLFQVNSRSEYSGNEAYLTVGLKPVEAFAWGMALNPLNSWGSIYFMKHCRSATNGAEYFRASSRSKRLVLLEKLCAGTAALAKAGLYNRDQHFGNVLIDDNEEFIWIDTHVSRLPFFRKRRFRTAIESVSRKMPNDEFRRLARKLLEQKLLGKKSTSMPDFKPSKSSDFPD